MLEVFFSEKDILHNIRHGIPKDVTSHPNGKLYYVDIRAGEVLEHDGIQKTLRRFPCLDPEGNHEFTTALGLNRDGSFIVARQSGLYYFNPAHPEELQWKHICDIPGVGETLRPNNGGMIQCHDGKTRFFLGTATIKGGVAPDDTPATLFVLVETAQGFHLKSLTENDPMSVVNAVSGQVIDGQTMVTYADSHPTNSIVRKAEFNAETGTFSSVGRFVDFKKYNSPTAKNGRPDGTSPIIYNDRHCAAFAEIDVNQARVLDLYDGTLLARMILPEGVNKPTMPTFISGDLSRDVLCYITTLAPDGSEDQRAGKIYVKAMPPGFDVFDYRGSYSSFHDIKGELTPLRPGARPDQRVETLHL